MAESISYNLFTARDIKKYLSIDKNLLFYWVQTKKLLKPTIVGIGRGKNNYFSLEDLATLSLIKVLRSYKIELWEIKEILEAIVSPNPIKISKIVIDKAKKVENKEVKVDTLFLYKENDEMIPPEGFNSAEPINVWQIYKRGRKLFDEEGLLLYIRKPFDTRKEEGIILIGTKKADFFPEEEIEYAMTSCLAINLVAIIKDLEEKTGLGF